MKVLTHCFSLNFGHIESKVYRSALWQLRFLRLDKEDMPSFRMTPAPLWTIALWHHAMTSWLLCQLPLPIANSGNDFEIDLRNEDSSDQNVLHLAMSVITLSYCGNDPLTWDYWCHTQLKFDLINTEVPLSLILLVCHTHSGTHCPTLLASYILQLQHFPKLN